MPDEQLFVNFGVIEFPLSRAADITLDKGTWRVGEIGASALFGGASLARKVAREMSRAFFGLFVPWGGQAALDERPQLLREHTRSTC